MILLMRTISLTVLCFFIILCCKKSNKTEPIGSEYIDEMCLVTKSEVAFDKILDEKRDGLVTIEQKFSADGKFISGSAVGVMFNKEIGSFEQLKLKSFKYNGQSHLISVNNYYSVNPTTESKVANWKMILDDNTTIEICVNQFPKVLILNKVKTPEMSKDWEVNFDISNNNADEISFSESAFLNGNTSILFKKINGSSASNFTAFFSKEDVVLASDNYKNYIKKDFTVYAGASKSFLKTVNGKRMHIEIKNVTIAKYPVL